MIKIFENGKAFRIVHTRSNLVVVALLILSSILLVAMAAAPPNFVDSVFVSGLNAPTAMEFSPDGRLFIAEQSGKLRVIKNGGLLPTPFVSISVNYVGERGLLGIAFDPNFVTATNKYVYVYYTTNTSPPHNRVSRFTVNPSNPDTALAGSELPILNLENLSAINHNGGAIHFGKDGKLYVAVGENGNSANSQSLTTRLGKILRINSDGTIPSDNPFYNTAGAKQEIWALGLRNPFTFAFSPASGSTLMYINDVGQDSWEEINSGAVGANYGWPTCEGSSCFNTNFVKPIYTYAHNGAGKSIAGGAFYESTQFPSEYRGSYFFGDYVAGFIKRLTPSNQVVDFLSGINSPVDIKIGPDGSLYYLSIGSGQVRKVQYTAPSNSNPDAVATANPTSGLPPLSITFDGSGSSDPNSGDVLSYSWNFGDGSPAASAVSVTHTYSATGSYVATLTVNDDKGGMDSATVNIAVGNPPVGAIDTPSEETNYNAGDTISFIGSGSDAEDGTLPASAFKWEILFHHNTHTHPFQEYNGVKSGSFTIPRLGEPNDDVWYRIYLTVTDSSGLSHLSTRDILPNKATITLTSNIPGLQVNLDGQPQTTPYSFVGVVGMTRTLQAASPQTLNGQTYQFQSWSDGGAATHTINTPASATTYTANYVVVPPSSSLTIGSQNANGNTITGYWTVLYNGGGNVVGTGFTPARFTLNSAQQYSVSVSDYGSASFHHWLDSGSTTRVRTISIFQATTITAVYCITGSPCQPAPPPSAAITLNPTSGPVGTSVTVTGTNFLANSEITIRYDGAIVPTTPSAITSTGTGAFTATISVPASTDGTRTISASDSGARTASSTFTVVSSGGTYPVIHMSDTSTSWGSLVYSGRQINAEYATASSQLVDDRIDSITLRLQKSGSPTGTAQVGIFNADLSVKKLFGTVDTSSVSTSYQDYEFKLSGSELYTIQSGDRIGIKYSGGDSSNGFLVMIDRDSGGPFDSTNSHRIRYEWSWLYYDTGEDLYMILKQTHG